MTDHTPTPWAADPDWREGYSWNIHIVDAANPDMRICFMTSDGPAQANAELIVKAVNNHATLIEALKDLVFAVEAEVNEKGGGGFILARLSDARNVLAAVSSPGKSS